jgi:hypothetical protein
MSDYFTHDQDIGSVGLNPQICEGANVEMRIEGRLLNVFIKHGLNVQLRHYIA